MKVSIITVCFNSSLFIRSAIESVLAQSYSDIEYIIIDGKSVDDTMGIIGEYIRKIYIMLNQKPPFSIDEVL